MLPSLGRIGITINRLLHPHPHPLTRSRRREALQPLKRLLLFRTVVNFKMKILTLIQYLLKLYFRYGNRPIDLIIETKKLQIEYPLGDLAYAPGEKRVKLLSEGFT